MAEIPRKSLYSHQLDTHMAAPADSGAPAVITVPAENKYVVIIAFQTKNESAEDV